MIPMIQMTRERANIILDLWRAGAEIFPPHVIAMALYRTGDLESLR